MKKNSYLGCIFLWLCCVILKNNAFIYQIRVLRIWKEEQQKYQYIIGCCDWHDRKSDISKQQRNYFEKFITTCPRDDTKVIVEDLSSDSLGNNGACETFVINTRGGMLGGLGQYCYNQGFEVDNIEYRYCRVASIAPILREKNSNLSNFPSANSILVHAIMEEIDMVMNELKVVFGRYDFSYKGFQYSLEKVMQEIEFLQLDRYKNETVATYLARYKYKENNKQFLKNLLSFDSMFLDLMIAKNILNTDHKSLIVAVAGGTHIKEAFDVLKQYGYGEVYVSPITTIPEKDPQKCLDTTLKSSRTCDTPLPIKLEMLENIISKYR